MTFIPGTLVHLTEDAYARRVWPARAKRYAGLDRTAVVGTVQGRKRHNRLHTCVLWGKYAVPEYPLTEDLELAQ